MNHVRPRTVYISSDSINDFIESDRNTVYLSENIGAEEGYNLSYGLASIGFNATVMNISKKLQNNSLSFLFEYDYTNVQYEMKAIPNPAPDAPQWEFIAIVPDTIEKTETVTISIPDGHYTFDELLRYLSNDSGETSNFVLSTKSGYCIDLQMNRQSVGNVLNFPLKWKPTENGYKISCEDDETPIRGWYDDKTAFAVDHYPLEQIQPKLISVTILPDERQSGLYDLLFTNYNATYEFTPISTPPDIRATGMNPPQGIQFLFPSDISPHYDAGVPITILTPFKFHFVIIDYEGVFGYTPKVIEIIELGNETIYNTPAGIYPNQKYNMHEYVAYYTPILDPVYIDIEISLPNSAMDERGHRNVLTRLFPVGAKDGNTSFFRQWEAPKMTLLTGFSTIGNISIDLSSQNNRWDFFNLEYSIELLFVEIQDEKEEITANDVSIAPTDPISDASTAVGGVQRRPLPSTHFTPYRTANLQIHKRTKFI